LVRVAQECEKVADEILIVYRFFKRLGFYEAKRHCI